MKLTYYIFAFLTMTAMTSQAETTAQKKLPPCKDSPNCVSSQATDKPHYIAPFKISGDPKRAWDEFRKAVLAHDRMTITHETDHSLHAEAISLVLQFVDDIDAILDANAGLIHIRSSSRVGHYDFGVNRKRVEALRTQLRKLHVLG